MTPGKMIKVFNKEPPKSATNTHLKEANKGGA
jgi:hypothetical protein